MAKEKKIWPDWWEWELDLSDHAYGTCPSADYGMATIKEATIKPLLAA